MSVLSKPRFHDEAAAFEYVEASSGLTALSARTAACMAGSSTTLKGKPAPHRPPEVRRLPQAVHRQGRHRVRACPHSAPQVASGDPPDVVQQEGHQLHQLHRTLEVTYKTRLVPGPPHPRSHALRRPGPVRRRRWRCRG